MKVANQTPLRTFRDAFAYFESFTNLERGKTPYTQRVYRLDRMRMLLSLFDNPQERYRSVHVAGTKGKGSTATFLAAVIGAAGVRTGLYTSPHVSDPAERIWTSHVPREDSRLASIASRIRDIVESSLPKFFPGDPSPTTFELLTLLAFQYFYEVGCEYVVMEAGIGGRLDATNVVHPIVSVLTPLDYDHTEILGTSLQQIAGEKAGIIKQTVPAFSSNQVPVVKGVFRRESRRRQTTMSFLDEEVQRLSVETSTTGTAFRLKMRGMPMREFGLSMLGEFQAENAALSYLTVRRVMPWIPEHSIRRGLRSARLAGRMELIGSAPQVVLDGAHTVLSAKRLLDAFLKVFPTKGILIFGSVLGKNHSGMATVLAPHFETIIISTPGYFKESDPDALFELFRALNPRTHLEKQPSAALERARATSRGTLPVLVTGSFYMISEIRKLLIPM